MSTSAIMVSEFQFIHNLRSKYGLNKIGDDCAVLPKGADTDLLLTADMLVEDIDFRLSWTTPEQVGHKALAVSLSDIAAMGGKPTWAMLSIGVPENLWKTDFVNRFYEGWFGVANKFGVELVGGDISRVPEKLIIDSIVGGEIPRGKAVLRSSAKPGDILFVTGTLGAAAAGLRLVENRIDHRSKSDDRAARLVHRQLQPMPQLMTANLLLELNIATSMIDISDGLSSDLDHICRASGVGARIFTDLLPIDGGLAKNFPADQSLKLALHGGEDYELLFTVKANSTLLLKGLPVTRIGEITATSGKMELICEGKPELLLPRGYRHFHSDTPAQQAIV